MYQFFYEDFIEGTNKSEFKDLLFLAPPELFFIFDDVLYKQKDGLAMELPLGPAITNFFSSRFIKSNGFNSTQKNLNQFFTEDILIAFSNWLNTSRNFVIILIIVILTCLFNLNKKKNGKLPFLDIEKSKENRKFVTTIFRKHTFDGVCTHFERFLSTVYKFGMLCTLAYHCFKIWSD